MNLHQRLALFLRRLFGTQQVYQELLELQQQVRGIHEQQNRLHQQLLAMGNTLAQSAPVSAEIRNSTTYRRCAAVVSLLAPMDVRTEKYLRVGGDYDGGYVMLDTFQQAKTIAAYSFGIGSNVTWDTAIAERGIDVFMYDHTIKRLPANHPRFHFHNCGVTGTKTGPALKTLAKLVADNGHAGADALILKMDVEGCEWDVFAASPQDVILQFSQILVEWHDLPSVIYGPQYPSAVAVLKKLNETHQCVHVHGNCLNLPLSVGDLVLPSVLEVTYVRRHDVLDKLTANTRHFPTELDHPNLPGWPDIHLGRFTPAP